jgi:nicotinamidase-related amidase
VEGTWGSEIIPELSPAPDEKIIRKKRLSGFFGTCLERLLLETGAATVEVVGVCTSICVMDTVGGLADRDYHIVVPREGVADFNRESHDFSLQRMQEIYGAEII